MSVDTPFYFLDQVRSSYFWNSPNQAGAFIACLIPPLWWVRSGRRAWFAQTLLLLTEIVLVWLLARTFSRGAVCALAVACVYTACLRSSELTTALRWLALRAAVAIPILAATGIWRRVVAVGTDAAVTNRWALYQGGLQMIADSPLGWGLGESGFAFSDWYQAVDVDIRYLGMVSTVLEIGVERGLPLLILLLVAAILSIALPFMLSAHRYTPAGSLLAAAGACTVAWLINACVSTITDAPSLWFPLIFGLATPAGHLLCSVRVASYLSARCVLVALLGGIALGAWIFAAGWMLNHTRSLAISPGAGFVEIERVDRETSSIVVHFLPDPDVLGDTWGKELRLAVRHSAFSPRAVVLDPRRVTSASIGSPTALFLFGTFCVPAWIRSENIVLVCPAHSPSDALHSVKALCLPAWDELGNRDAWQSWAQRNAVPVVIVPGCGQDVRGEWHLLFDSVIAHALPSARRS